MKQEEEQTRVALLEQQVLMRVSSKFSLTFEKLEFFLMFTLLYEEPFVSSIKCFFLNLTKVLKVTTYTSHMFPLLSLG